MKKLLPIIPFTVTLAMTILVVMMFGATGDASMAFLFPFCVIAVLFTHDKLHE